MGDQRIWKAILITLAVTAAVIVLLLVDPGFLSVFMRGVIPVSTGERIEVLIVSTSPVRGPSGTDLYWVEPDGSFKKVAAFDPPAHCVTAFDGKLFVTFQDQSSGVIKDGKWVRGVSPPGDFRIFDVAPLDGTVHAFSVLNAAGLFKPGDGVRVAALTENGWETPAAPYEAGRRIWFMGCVEVDGGIEVLLAEGEETFTGMPDIAGAKWFHVLFDGDGWGPERELAVPQRMFPNISAYEGRLAFTLMPLDEGRPVQLAFESDGDLEVVCDIAPVEKGQVLHAWLVALAGEYRVVLVGAGSIWMVPIQDFKAGEPVRLLQTSRWARLRSNIYVGVLVLCAILLVALGLTWLVMRLASIGKGAGA